MSLNDIVTIFKHLRTDSGEDKYPIATLHRAPHKPILLLCLLDLAEQGKLTANFVSITSELSELFRNYWVKVMPVDRHANLALPFFHLKSDGFWYLIPQQGKEDALAEIRQIAGMAQLLRTVLGAQLDEDVYSLVCIAESRDILRTALIGQYFHEEYRAVLMEQSRVNLGVFKYSETLLEQVHLGTSIALNPLEAEKHQVRTQGFRHAIITAYDHRCVLCGIRLVTDEGLTMAEAAHIIPWSMTHNDDPRNGLCLCPMCHWVFDKGIAGINDYQRVKLSRQLHNSGNIAGHLSTLDSRPIFEPIDVIYNPASESLKWHMENVFLR